MEQERLQMFYMKKNPKYRWGYDCCKEDCELAKEVGVLYDFKYQETRDQFLARMKDYPRRNMYGSKQDKDTTIIFGNWKDRVGIAKKGYGLDKLVHDEDPRVRIAVAKQGYKLDYMLEKETDANVLKAIIRSMKEYNTFYWIPKDKIELLTEEAALLYLTIISQVGLNSEEDTKRFKEFMQNIIKKFGTSSKFSSVSDIKSVSDICKKYNIKTLIGGTPLFDKRCGTYEDFAKFSIMYDGKRGNEVKIGKFKIVHVEDRSLVNDVEWWWEAYYEKKLIIRTADLTEAMYQCYNRHVINCQEDKNKSLFTEAAYLCDIDNSPAYFMMEALYKATDLTLREEMNSLKAEGYAIHDMMLVDNELGGVLFKVASKSPTGMFSLLDWIKIGAQR